MGKMLTALVVIALLFGAMVSGCTGGAQDSTSVDVSTDDGGDTVEDVEETPAETEAPAETKKPTIMLGCG